MNTSLKISDHLSVAAQILITATIMFFIFTIDWNPFTKESTVYLAGCISKEGESVCPENGWRTWRKINYRPDIEAKTVVYWSESEAPRKYDNCAIADVENWSCSSGESVHHMVKGVVNDFSPNGAYVRSISKRQWWWMKILKM